MPDQPEALGLLALMLLHDARGRRVTSTACSSPLDRQDRSRWDQGRVRRGACEALERALAQRLPGPYQLQAAIAAVHAQSPDWEQTDWARIAEYYEASAASPSRVVEVQPLWRSATRRASRRPRPAGATGAGGHAGRLPAAPRGPPSCYAGPATGTAADAYRRGIELSTNDVERAELNGDWRHYDGLATPDLHPGPEAGGHPPASRRGHRRLVATAAGDTPLLPLSFLWDGETFLVATSESGRTGRNLAATGKVRLGLGLVRDVVLVEGTVEAVLAPEDIPGTWASAQRPRPASTPGPRAPPPLLPDPSLPHPGLARGQRARRPRPDARRRLAQSTLKIRPGGRRRIGGREPARQDGSVRRKYLLALGALAVISVMAVLVASGADPAEVGEPVDVDDLPVLADDVPGPTRPTGGSAASPDPRRWTGRWSSTTSGPTRA